jgi:transposase InsO family protein
MSYLHALVPPPGHPQAGAAPDAADGTGRHLPAIHHSDRGVQYACGPYRKILDRYGIKASMSRKGDCGDNAPMESFFSSIETELVHRTQFRTGAEAKAALFEYIEIFYNRKRRHSGIDYRTPAQAHAEMLIQAAA